MKAHLKTDRRPRKDAITGRNNYIAISCLLGDENVNTMAIKYGLTRERITQIVKDYCHKANPKLSLSLQPRPGYGVRMLREFHREFITAGDASWYDKVRKAEGHKVDVPTKKRTTHKFWQRA